MDEELKPCPFCGLHVEMKHKLGDYGYTPNTVSIRCEKCGCGFCEPTEAWEQGRGHYSIKELSELRVIRAWNRRFEGSSRDAFRYKFIKEELAQGMDYRMDGTMIFRVRSLHGRAHNFDEAVDNLITEATQ